MPMNKLTFAAIALALLGSTGFSLAQQRTPAAPPPAPSTNPQQSPTAPDLAELKKFLQEQVARAEELSKRQGETWNQLQQGEQYYDSLIADFQKLIDVVGPTSDFAKSMESLIARFEDRVKWAAGHANPEIRALTDEFQKNVQDARNVLADGIATADAARGTLNALKSNKEVLIAKWELDKGREMIARYRAAINILKETRGRLQDLADRASNLPKPTPTQ
jgi:hypothetical protein